MFFVVPFIADGVASDWPMACSCLKRTLRSILANPHDDLRVAVICQDPQPFDFDDHRCLWVQTSLRKPDKSDYWAKGRDKGGKIVEGFKIAKSFSPDYISIVDADDLISNNLVSYVRSRPNMDGFVLKTGYQWVDGDSYFARLPQFNQRCATSFVWRFDKCVFPVWVGGDFKAERIGDQGHNLVEEAMDRSGLMVCKVFEPKAVYVTGHSNHLGRAHEMNKMQRLKKKLLYLARREKISTELRREFSL